MEIKFVFDLNLKKIVLNTTNAFLATCGLYAMSHLNSQFENNIRTIEMCFIIKSQNISTKNWLKTALK
jgi:hypothetical protein